MREILKEMYEIQETTKRLDDKVSYISGKLSDIRFLMYFLALVLSWKYIKLIILGIFYGAIWMVAFLSGNHQLSYSEKQIIFAVLFILGIIGGGVQIAQLIHAKTKKSSDKA